jgi:hypothetical protein
MRIASWCEVGQLDRPLAPFSGMTEIEALSAELPAEDPELPDLVAEDVT